MFSNEDEVLLAFKEAKKGSLKDQKLLYTYAERITIPITLKYASILRNSAINYTDLRNLVTTTFYIVLTEANRDVINFSNYFKYLYINTVKYEIRKQFNGERQLHNYAMKGSALIEDDNLVSANENSQKEIKKSIESSEIVDQVVSDNRSFLTKREKEILIYYVNGFDIKSIAEKEQINYYTVYKHLQNSLRKCQEYINTYLTDISDLYK